MLLIIYLRNTRSISFLRFQMEKFANNGSDWLQVFQETTDIIDYNSHVEYVTMHSHDCHVRAKCQ